MKETFAYPIDRNLYLNICNRCTLTCWFCPKHQGTQNVKGFELDLNKSPRAEMVIKAMGDVKQYQEIVFCGLGEPTLRLKTLLEIAQHIKTQGGTVRVNTDGLANLVYKRNVIPEMAPVVDALSVSMNAQNEAIYNQHCKPRLPGAYEAMLDFLKQAKKEIPNVTATAIEGLLGIDIQACEKLAHQLGVRFRKRVLGIVG